MKQGFRTVPFPSKNISLPERYRGLPVLKATPCPRDCHACAEACPTGAVSCAGTQVQLDLGKCLFCPDCQDVCPNKTITFSKEYRMSATDRSQLIITPEYLALEKNVKENIKKMFGRSLKLRQVSAGGCNGCELDTNVLNTLAFDLGRFGIQFVASPRHADGIIVTGPVTKNMREALRKTYEAVPSPKIVIAVGACAISGGPYVGHAEVHDGAGSTLPAIDLYIPGCPPHPFTILQGLLDLLGRVK